MSFSKVLLLLVIFVGVSTQQDIFVGEVSGVEVIDYDSLDHSSEVERDQIEVFFNNDDDLKRASSNKCASTKPLISYQPVWISSCAIVNDKKSLDCYKLSDFFQNSASIEKVEINGFECSTAERKDCKTIKLIENKDFSSAKDKLCFSRESSRVCKDKSSCVRIYAIAASSKAKSIFTSDCYASTSVIFGKNTQSLKGLKTSDGSTKVQCMNIYVPPVTTALTTGVTTALTTGITTAQTTGITTGVTTGITTGITTGETTGITTGVTTGVTTGITTALSTGVYIAPPSKPYTIKGAGNYAQGYNTFFVFGTIIQADRVLYITKFEKECTMGVWNREGQTKNRISVYEEFTEIFTMNFPDTPCVKRQVYEFIPNVPIRLKAGKQHAIQFSTQLGDDGYEYLGENVDPILYSGTEPGYDKRVYFQYGFGGGRIGSNWGQSHVYDKFNWYFSETLPAV